jgi:hypothetical protein
VCPTQLEFVDGTSAAPPHWLAGTLMPGGTLAKGAWISTNATTLRGVNAASAFVTVDPPVGQSGSHSQSWPAPNTKWFHVFKSPNPLKLVYRGYDSTYTAAAVRDNLELQLGECTQGTMYGRNTRSCWQGVSACHTNNVASNTLTLTDNPPVFTHTTITQLAYRNPATGGPIFVTGTYNGTAKTFTRSSGTFPAISSGSPWHYDFLDADYGEELYYDEDGQTNGDNLRRIFGDGRLDVLANGSEPAKTETWHVLKLGAADDGAFTAAPTVSQMTETDVLGVHIADGAASYAYVAARAHPACEGGGAFVTDWLTATDFLIPTLTTTVVHLVNMRPGVTVSLSGAVEAGTNMRVTISASGAITIPTSGRLTLNVSHSSGVVTVVRVS